MTAHETVAPPLDARTIRPSPTWTFVALAVLVPALVLRVAWPDAIEFAGEQIEALALTCKSLGAGGASHGVRVSVGVDMPPFFLWILSLPLLVTRDPMLVTGFVMAVNLAALLGLFLLLRRFVDPHVAWLAMILTAAAPWATIFARKIWAQDFLFPGLIVFMVAFFGLQLRYSRVRLWSCMLVFSLLEQLYPSTWFLVPPLVAYVWIFRIRAPRRDVLVGLAIAVLPWIPYVVYQVSIGFDDLLRAWSLRNVDGDKELLMTRNPWAHFVGAVRLAGGTGLEYTLGKGGMDAWQERSFVSTLLGLSWVFLVASAAAVAHAVGWSALRIRDARRGLPVPLQDRVVVFFALMIVGLIAAFSLLQLPALPHYEVILLPAVTTLIAWSLVRWLRGFGERRNALALAAIVPFTLAHEALWSSFVSYAAVDGNKVEGRYGPLYCVRRAAWNTELADQIDEALHGVEHRAARQQGLLARFEAAHDVLLDFDPARNVPPISAQGCRLAPVQSEKESGLEVRMQSHPHMIELPSFEFPSDGKAMLKLDLSVPIDTILLVFYQTRAVPEYRRAQVYEVRVSAGRHVVCIPLDAPGISGRVRLRMEAYRYVVHALEVRRVGG